MRLMPPERPRCMQQSAKMSAPSVCSSMAWLVWKCYGIFDVTANTQNNYWPDRPMALGIECAMAVIMAAMAAWLIHDTRIHWRHRQIGGIR